MTDATIRSNLMRLKKELAATITLIDNELNSVKPTLKLLVPKDDSEHRCNLMGHRDVLVFVQTLMDKIFYSESGSEDDDTRLKHFDEQVDKSITLIADTLKNSKSLHPAIGIPDLTDEQYYQMVGRQEMFVHLREVLTEFGL